MFISNAYAEAGAAGQSAGFLEFLPLIALLAVFYFLVIRPQSKRVKEHRSMVEALKRGDEIVTVGGAVGRITEVFEQYVKVELTDNVEITVQKQSVQSVLPKGTLKSIK